MMDFTIKIKLVKQIIKFNLRLFRVLILVVFILVAMFVVAIDKMLPYQLITIAIPSLFFIGAILSIALMKWQIHLSINIPKGKELEKIILSYVRRHKVKIFLIIASFFTIVSLPRVVSSYKDRGFVNDSLKHFAIISTPAVSVERVNLTRVLLEKALREIGSYAKVSVTEPIKVHLYSNASEFQQATGSPKSVSGLTRWSNKAIEIYIPAELPPDNKPIFNEGTPVHELTHAIELLITNNPRSLPLWFREGLANQHQDFWKRVLIHVGVWMERDKIMSYERLSLFRYNYPQEELEKQFFYSTSYEFVRYLFMRYGESTFWEIIQEVGKGALYENVIYETTNRNEKELYNDWLEEWLQGEK